MTNEMRELVARAQSGDADSQFDLGRAFALGVDGFPQNTAEGILWLKACRDRVWGANNLLIGMSMSERFGPQNPELLIESFEKLVYVHKDVRAMVTFGAILCGDFYNRHINEERGGIPVLAEKPYNNPARGFRLIEEGVKIAESMPENPLGYGEYDEISSAYHNETKKLHRKESSGSSCFSRSESIAALTKKADYAQKTLVALKQGRGVSEQEKEHMAELIKIAEDFAAGANGELNHRKSAIEIATKNVRMLRQMRLAEIADAAEKAYESFDYEKGDAIVNTHKNSL